jgi:hypothetical protein
VSCVPSATAGCRPAPSPPAEHRLRAVRHRHARGDRHHRRPAGAHQARRPSGTVGHPPGGDRARQRRRALPRGLRARARGRPRGQGSLGVRRAGRRAGGQPPRHAGGRRHGRRRVGDRGDRRRGRATRSQRPHRARRPHGLHVGPRALPGARPGELGQRSPAELPAPADGAHDEHLPPRRRGRPRGDRAQHRPRGVHRQARWRVRQHRHRGLRLRDDRELPHRGRGDHRAAPEGNLIGNGPAVLGAIDACGDDFAMGGPGTCGKDGQSVPSASGSRRCGSRA